MLKLKLNRILSLLLFLAASIGYAQTGHSFPAEDTNNAFTGINSFVHINSTYYVGAVTGQYTSIQSAITLACNSTNKAVVNIPSGSSPTDSVGVVVRGCSNVGIVDERTNPPTYYNWTGTIYNPISFGAGVYTGSASIAVEGTPLVNQVCINVSSSTCMFAQLNADQILPGFTINSFSLYTGQTNPVEIGAVVANPIFLASYSAVPSSAYITNTDDINSPFTLLTPFTAATITGSFHHTTATSTTFNLFATGTSVQTAAVVVSWQPRTFSGSGTTGATSATGSGTSAILNSGLGTLASAGLNNQSSYTCSPSGQVCYVLMIGGSHTFTSGGFSFPMNTPTPVTFVNAYGASVNMYLYQSTNVLTGNFTLVVAS